MVKEKDTEISTLREQLETRGSEKDSIHREVSTEVYIWLSVWSSYYVCVYQLQLEYYQSQVDALQSQMKIRESLSSDQQKKVGEVL